MNLISIKPRLLTAGTLATLLAAAALSAQTAPAASARPGEDAIKMSEFNVSAESSRGYIASESMTGTRVATPIKDLPFSVNVLTTEFFEDFAMFELNDNVAYIGGLTGLDQGGGFNLRGFGATNQLRDGFYRLGRYGSSNVDRIEVIRGPNAAIYGQTSPGGMINMISKRPKKTPSLKLKLSAGDYDSNRETLDVTGPVGFLGNTYYIGTFGFYERGYETPYSTLRNKEGYVALTHEFRDRSSLFVSAEYFHRQVNSPASSAPFILNDQNTTTANDDKITGLAKNLATVQQFGPNSELNRGMVFVNAIYEKRFTPVFSTRIGSNYFRARRWDFNQNVGATQYNPRTNILQRGATPNKGIIFEDGGALQADLLATYSTNERAIHHRTLATFDFNDYYRYDPNWSISGADLALWTPIRNIVPGQPVQYYPKWFDWANHTPGRKNKNRTRVIGGLIREQATLLDSRLLLFGGGRWDRVNYNLRDLAAARQSTFTVHQFNPNVGINYKLTPQLATYANYSRSFFPNQQFITAASINPAYKSETAEGYDYGFKGSFLQDRLNFTIAGYYITRENVVVNVVNAITGVTESLPEGNHLVRGAEFDFNWQIDNDLTFGGSYGRVHSRITDFGDRTLSVGRSPARITPNNFGLYLKYAPGAGSLKGFSANLGVTYLDATPTEAPDAGDTYTGKTFTRSTDQWAVKVPSATVWNLGLRYALPRTGGNRVGHEFGVNVNNLLDLNYLTPGKSQGDRRSVYFTYTLSSGGR